MKNDLIIENFPVSQIEFEKLFNNYQAHIDYLLKAKCPRWLLLPVMRTQGISDQRKALYICRRYVLPYFLTSVKVIHVPKKPFTFLFKTVWLFTTCKAMFNAVSVKELLGFGSYQPAWVLLHELRGQTIRRGREPLSGDVENDDLSVDSQQLCRRGIGVNGKNIVLTAVEI